MKRILKMLARMYPAGWRERYGAEYEALIEDAEPRARDGFDVLWGAMTMRITARSVVWIVLPCVIVGGLVAAVYAWIRPVQYTSGTVVAVISKYEPPKLVDESGRTVALAKEGHEPQDRQFLELTAAAFDRDFLASEILEKNLYPGERARMPLNDVVEKMWRAINVRTVSQSLSTEKDVSLFTVQFNYSDPHVAQQVERALMSQLITFNLRSAIKRPGTLSQRGETYGIADAPSLPQKPTGPNWIELGVMGLLGGLACGIVASFLAGSRRGRVAAMGLASLGMLGGVAAGGQEVVHANGSLPSFEVATIKPDRSTGPIPFNIPPPNVFRNTNVTARDLIRVAYGLPPGPASTRVLGGPGWIDNNHYDVDAKIPDIVFAEMQKMSPRERGREMFLMVQSLLMERFKFVAHIETREQPIYELVVAKGGPKLVLAKESSPGMDESPSGPGHSRLPQPQDTLPILAVNTKASDVMELVARGQPLDALAQIPIWGIGRVVVNKTGLTAKYDFTLDWGASRGGPATSAGDTPIEKAPSLADALEEQLGLKLVSTKGPVEVIVIDHIELPTEN